MSGLRASRHAPGSRQSTSCSNATHRSSSLPAAPARADCCNDTPSRIPTALTTSHPSYNLHNAQYPSPHAKHELARYSKIIRRLQWKLPFLAQGYNLAIDRLGKDPVAVAEAELMFRLDFFEYYMLIERALVHLLGVYGVDVPKGGWNQPCADNAGKSNGLAGSAWSENKGQHRYHANVLAALDKEDNPLHETLGTGEVRKRLGRAKDLRNRWKTAGEEGCELEANNGSLEGSATAKGEREWHTKRVAAPLETYDLERMLEIIFKGLDDAYHVAEQFVRDGARPNTDADMDMVEDDGRVGHDGVGPWEEEDQWGFMVDAMDWEAV